MHSGVLITSQWLFSSPASKCLKHYRKDDYDDFQWEWMPKLYQLYVCENDLMGNAIRHANRVALYGVQIEQEGIWPTEQLLLIAREASLWYSHMCEYHQESDSSSRTHENAGTARMGSGGKRGWHWCLALPSLMGCEIYILSVYAFWRNVCGKIIGKITFVHFFLC